jgi:hypothetical protein
MIDKEVLTGLRAASRLVPNLEHGLAGAKLDGDATTDRIVGAKGQTATEDHWTARHDNTRFASLIHRLSQRRRSAAVEIGPSPVHRGNRVGPHRQTRGGESRLAAA